MPTELTRPPVQMLRDSLRADSPLREMSIAKLLIGCCVVAIPFVFSLGIFNGWALPLAINSFLLAVAGYYSLVLRAMKRGWFHPAVPWVGVMIEVTVPVIILSMTALVRGPEYTLMTPTHVIWGALVVTSALRAKPELSLLAGILAAFEWLIVYAFLVYPVLPANAGPSAKVPSAVLRAVILLMTGGIGIMFAKHYIRKAEEALSAVREQDLMGKYFLHERIGAGGMAEVYRATYCPEGGFQKPVAIKRVLPSYSRSESFTEMFREEARLCASLTHPNIVQVFDCGKFRDTFILAMEYVDGLTLGKLIRRLKRPLPLNAVSFLGIELARALDYIHKRVDAKGQPLHLVHRDVNPPNILISRIGEVKLTDFGVANAATRHQTGRADVFYGKLHYAAPEQLVTGPFDGRADLFALGLTLNEALTQKKVYGSDSDSALNQGIFPRIPRPSELRPEVPEAFDALVMSLCAIDRDQRIPTGAEVRAMLTALTGDAAPFPAGQQALAAAVEEALLTNPNDSRITKTRDKVGSNAAKPKTDKSSSKRRKTVSGAVAASRVSSPGQQPAAASGQGSSSSGAQATPHPAPLAGTPARGSVAASSQRSSGAISLPPRASSSAGDAPAPVPAASVQAAVAAPTPAIAITAIHDFADVEAALEMHTDVPGAGGPKVPETTGEIDRTQPISAKR